LQKKNPRRLYTDRPVCGIKETKKAQKYFKAIMISQDMMLFGIKMVHGSMVPRFHGASINAALT